MRVIALIGLVLCSLVAAGQPCKVLIPAIDSSYEGGCREGLAHGKGKASGTDCYEGEFRKGLPHGEGIYRYKNGDIYTGEWKRGLRDGYGRFTRALQKQVEEGYWREGDLIPTIDEDDWLQEYSLKKHIGVVNINFRSTASTGTTIKVFLFRNSSPVTVYEMKMISTSGTAELNAGNPVFTYVTFPFAARLNYKLPDSGGAVITEGMAEFVITREGDWEVMVFH